MVQDKPAAQTVSQYPSSNKPQAQGAVAQGRPQLATGAYQPLPTQLPTGMSPGKPRAQAGTLQAKPQAQPTLTQIHLNKPQAQIIAQGRSQVVAGAPPLLPNRPQAPPTATQPFPNKPQVQNGTAQGRPQIAAGTPQYVASKAQGPAGVLQGQSQAPYKTPQPHPNKVQVQSCMYPQGQYGASTYPAPLYMKPQPSGPAQSQKATPEQRNTILPQNVPVSGNVPSSAGAPRQVGYIQNEYSSSEWKPVPAPSHHYEPFSSTIQHGVQGSFKTTRTSRELSGSQDSQKNKSERVSGGKAAAATGAGIIAGVAGGYLLSSHMDEHDSESNTVNNYTYTDYANVHHQPVTYDSDHRFSDLESPAEESEHSEEVSESEHSDNDHDSEDGSDEDEVISYRELEFTDSEHSDGHISSDDAGDTDMNESGDDDHESSDFEGNELDSPHMAAGFADDDASESGSDDFPAELDSDVSPDSDVGQPEGESSASEGESDAQNDSDEDSATDSDAGSDDEQHEVMHEQYQNQGHLDEHYGPQDHFQEQYQPQYQPQYQQQVPEQSASEDERQDESDDNDEQGVNSDDDVGDSFAVPDYDSDEQVEAVGGQYGGEDWGEGYESDY
jgi:hypothetical protein